MVKVLHHHHGHGHHHHGHNHNHLNNNSDEEECHSFQEAEEVEESDELLTRPNGSGGLDLNVRAALIHVIGDIIQSIGVLIASIIIWIKPEYKIADPICTFLFSIIVVFSTTHVLKDVVHILMEGKYLKFNLT